MKFLVTGGNGFLGSKIVQYLLEEIKTNRANTSSPDFHKIIVLGRQSSLQILVQDLYLPMMEYVQADISKLDSILPYFENVDTVFHVAAKAGIWGSQEEYFPTNVGGTINVIQACRIHSVSKLIYTSSPSVVFDGKEHKNANNSLLYPKQFNTSYALSKCLAEQLVLRANDSKLMTIALRPHLIWGPGDPHLIPSLLQRARTGKLIPVGNMKNQVSMTYIDNAAIAHIQAFKAMNITNKCLGKAYFINDPIPVLLWDWILVLLIRLRIRKTRFYFRIPYFIAMFWSKLMKLWWKILKIKSQPRLTCFLVQQLGCNHTYSIKEAQEDFGYTPITSYEEGMLKTINYFTKTL